MRKTTATILLALATGAAPLLAQPSNSERIDQLESALESLQEQNRALRQELQELKQHLPTTPAPATPAPAPAAPATPAAPAAQPPATATPAAPADNDIRVYWKDGLRTETRDGETYRGKLLSGRIQLDAGAGFADDDIEAVTGDLPFAARFRRLRLATSGEIGAWQPIEYKVELDFAGAGVSLKDAYVRVGDLPVIGGLKFGHFKEPFSLEESVSSLTVTFMERALPVLAFAPTRSTGVMVGQPVLEDRMTWALSAISDLGADASGQIDSNYHVTGRLTGLPLYQNDGRQMLHLGASLNFVEPEDEDARFRARPESSLMPRFVDTGATPFPADHLLKAGAEAGAVFGPFSVQSELIHTWVDSPMADDPSFFGFYLYGSWILTGEHRGYSRSKGAFTGVTPKHPFSLSEHGLGAWELALRYSHLDLNDGTIKGGKLDDLTAGVNWYLNPNTRWSLNYILADLNRAAADEVAHILQTRLQVSF